jgi:geranyl-CoA carboxylase beta subunit
MGLKKSLRAQELARDNKLPLIWLVESGGANLIYQAEIFIEGGRSFANQARLSAAGIPQIAVVHGASTAGGAYLPGLSDYVILVRGRSSIYLAGPPLVKAAIGEDSDEETLGGAETHTPQVTGLGEYLCENDAHAIATAREVMDKLNWIGVPPAPTLPCRARFPAEELLGLVPADEREPYDVREVIARLVDASDFLEFKAAYSPTRSAAMPACMATPSASSATTARSSPAARPRRRSSSSSATRAARR